MHVPSVWSEWAGGLRRWGLDEPAAVLLEAAGPFSVFLVQFVYLGQPFFEKTISKGHWQVLTQMLENQDQLKSFVAFLRQENRV